MRNPKSEIRNAKKNSGVWRVPCSVSHVLNVVELLRHFARIHGTRNTKHVSVFGFQISSFGFALALSSTVAIGQTTNTAPTLIDLPSALRLAGAASLDVQIARERLNEAKAQHDSAIEQFFPWLSPGVVYHRRDGMAQSVPAGIVSEAHFDSYAPGATIGGQVILGDAIYNSLAARQKVRASDQALAAQHQDSTLAAAEGYFDLAKARTLTDVAKQAAQTSRDYQQQLHAATEAGIAFKGDELRVQTQTERYEIAARQALERQRIAAADLAEVLHLDPAVELAPVPDEFAPVRLISTNAALDSLVQWALHSRPEVGQSRALVSAAQVSRDGAAYGPLIPTLNGQAFLGGLGGGPDNGRSKFGASEDYLVGLSWRIGPGGLFDRGRLKDNKAQLALTELNDAKLRDRIVREVVTALARVQSLSDQIVLAERNLATATEALRLTRERKQFGVGVVLEDIEAQQDLVRARFDYVETIAEFNKAEYRLNRAVGGPLEPGAHDRSKP